MRIEQDGQRCGNVRKLTDETSLKVSTRRSFEVQNFVIKVTKSRDCHGTITQMGRKRSEFVFRLNVAEDKSIVALDR